MLFLPFDFETRHDGVVTCNALYDGKALEKKCSNEKAKRIRLEKREANKKRNKAERDMVEITQQPPDDDEEEEEDV